MNFKDLHPPIIEIPAHQTWHRVQRTSARRDSVRFKGYVLAPPGGLAGRFDLADEPTAYLADSPETALYESLFRREVRSCHWDRLDQRSLVSFDGRASLRLADLRGLEERYPVLQSMRYETSQKFAQDCRQQELHGILYASAQHPYHSCVCLFKAGMERTKKVTAFALVEPGSGNLLKSVANAARGSQVPIVREQFWRKLEVANCDFGAVLEWRKPFWETLPAAARPDTVHPVLVYADLLATGDARCIETAKVVYDEHLARPLPAA